MLSATTYGGATQSFCTWRWPKGQEVITLSVSVGVHRVGEGQNEGRETAQVPLGKWIL